MSLFKCKMCGGDLEIAEGVTIAECEYCGTKQTVPKAMDENLQNLFNRANTLRIKSEFDKAEKLYEKIIQADTTQSEAYWGLILCKYGIEYVDDPKTFKKIPTCHRASFDSIVADDDYKSALENADISQRAIYEEQAKEIDRIQKEILALAQKEESYDVFICYKETDSDGHRTQDSVIANDIYYQLTEEGFKVFYAAITLEGKLGSAYEPIIFAALNSAKVMLAIGTKPEYFNAVWVKNEWSRFLKIIKKDRSKLLIPCYRDMDAYELPEEFAHLQAQDMAKIGFINDLVRGIKKVVKKDEPKQTTVVKETVVSSSNSNVAPLLKRAFMFLEDGDWQSSNEYCEKVLDIDPECAEAYLGKLMAELHVKKQDQLKNCPEPFGNRNNYQKTMRFADDKLQSVLSGYIEHINTRKENARLENIYSHAIISMQNAKREIEYKEAADIFKSIYQYKDANVLATQCLEKAKIARDEELEKAKHTEEEKQKCEMLFKSFRQYKEMIVKDNVIANDDIIVLTEKHSSLFCFNNEWLQISEEIEALFEKLKTTKEKLSSLDIEKATLPFFSIKKKIEINNNILELENYSSDLVKKIMDLKETKQNYLFKELKKYALGRKLLMQYDLYKQCKEGKYIKFGKYEQDNNIRNGKEDIEWLVLEVVNNKRAFLVSRYILDGKKYQEETSKPLSWKNSTIRSWLNSTFIDSAFSADEQMAISTTTLSTEDSQDKVFLLSISETCKYFNSRQSKFCYPTKFAVAITPEMNINQDTGHCKWWLRSLGSYHWAAACVHNQLYSNVPSGIDEPGDKANYYTQGIRPAMWIDFSQINN